MRGWLVASDVTLRPAPCLEIYLDGPRVPERERRVDICLPVSESP